MLSSVVATSQYTKGLILKFYFTLMQLYSYGSENSTVNDIFFIILQIPSFSAVTLIYTLFIILFKLG